MVISNARINFFDADAAGVLFHGKYFELCHTALESFLLSQVKYAEYFSSPEIAFPVVHSEASYFSPLIPGDEVEIAISLIEIRNSSFGLLFKIKKVSGEVAAEIQTVTVSVEKKKWQKTALPPFIIDLLNSL